MGALRLTLLGGFQAVVDPEPPSRLPTKKAQALLAYLTLQPGQASTRDKLAGLLWGELDNGRARSNLRQTLFVLRQSLSRATPPCLLGDGETVSLGAAPAYIDVMAFVQCAMEGSPASLEKAATLYQGDLLDGFALPEAAFDEWLTIERERLRAMVSQVLTKLLAHQSRLPDIPTAIQTALRLIGLDPLQEAVHRALMSLYAGQGRWATALKQYQHCVDVLQRELGVDPEPETQRLYQAILQKRKIGTVGSGSVGPPAAPLPNPEERGPTYASTKETQLVGRDGELVQMRDAMDEAWRAHGRLVVLAGEAGIGKTRVAQEMAHEAARRGGRVLLGRCHASEQILAFGPWVDAVRRGGVRDDCEAVAKLGSIWRSELARLLPELAVAGMDRPNEPAEYLRLFEAMARLLEGLATEQPLLVILDDLHWADEMSLRVLSFIGRRISRRRILIIGTARTEEIAEKPALRQAMQELRTDQCVTEVILSRLSCDQTRALIRSLRQSGVDATPPPYADHVWTASEGNPFMVVESVRALQHGAPLRTDHIALPERIRQLLTDRLDHLGESRRRLVSIAAIIGRDFEFALLQRAADLDESQVAEGVEELVRRGVLRAVGERFHFVHDWMREVADTHVLSPTREVLHRKVGAALEEMQAANLESHDAALSYHYEQGEAWHKALTYLRRAGLQATARSAYREAASFLERALAALARLPTTRDLVTQAIDMRFELRNSLIPLGQSTFDNLRKAQALAEGISDQHRLARALAFMTEQMFLVGDHQGAVALGARALELAQASGDRAIEVTTTRQLARAHYALGDYRQAVPPLQLLVETLTGNLLLERFDSPPIASVSTRMYLAWCLGDLGRFADGLVVAEEARSIAETADHKLSIVLACHGYGIVALERGDIPAAMASLERSLDLISAWDLGTFFPAGASALGAAMVIADRATEAIPLLERAVSAAEAAGRAEGQSIRVAGLADAYSRVGRSPEAIQLALRALALAREHGERGREARILRVLGDIHMRDSGERLDECEGYYRQGLTLAEALEMRPLAAHCHFGLARVLSRMGRGLQVEAHHSAAMSLYRDLGMPFWSQLLEQECGDSSRK